MSADDHNWTSYTILRFLAVKKTFRFAILGITGWHCSYMVGIGILYCLKCHNIYFTALPTPKPIPAIFFYYYFTVYDGDGRWSPLDIIYYIITVVSLWIYSATPHGLGFPAAGFGKSAIICIFGISSYTARVAWDCGWGRGAVLCENIPLHY